MLQKLNFQILLTQLLHVMSYIITLHNQNQEINIDTLLLIYRPYSNFTCALFLNKDPIQNHMLQLDDKSVLSSLSGTAPQSFFAFHDLDAFEENWQS